MPDWTSRPFHRSLDALAELAARETGASGYAYLERDVERGSTVKLSGSFPIDDDLVNQSSLAAAEYPLGRKGSSSVHIAFEFPTEQGAETARGRLEPLVESIRTLWQLETADTYNGLAKRLADLELELMDSKIVDRARGLLTSHADSEPSEAIGRHVLNVVRPGPTQRTLEEALATLKDEIEERKLVSKAKEILVGVRGISEEEAHTELRRASRKSRKRLRDVALQIIGTR